ncbi:MAG TPA: ribulose-phosphate 3-epimerase [Candidatus Nanoarchaeia archaeon]|nr:ribulose-phosphate 3-epimerase [Candidatus Nanoarchaeia archaeon]
MKIKVSVSVLTLFKDGDDKVEEGIKQIGDCADYVHFDIMDGKFVPPVTIGSKETRELTTKLPKDVHLMVQEPIRYIDDFIDAGASIITVHVEACLDVKKTIDYIRKKKVHPAISLKPKTPLKEIMPYLDMVDMVLVMSVEPGYPRQKFMPEVLKKVRELRKLKPKLDIEIDGGINNETAELAVKAGANVIVSGSFIFDSGNPKKAIALLKECK